MARNNDLRDGVADLSVKSFTPCHVRDDPLIFSFRAAQTTKSQPSGSTDPPSAKKSYSTKEKGNLLISDLWNNVTNSVNNKSVMKTDTKSLLEKTSYGA